MLSRTIVDNLYKQLAELRNGRIEPGGIFMNFLIAPKIKAVNCFALDGFTVLII
jgi:hypothetical protein